MAVPLPQAGGTGLLPKAQFLLCKPLWLVVYRSAGSSCDAYWILLSLSWWWPVPACDRLCIPGRAGQTWFVVCRSAGSSCDAYKIPLRPSCIMLVVCSSGVVLWLFPLWEKTVARRKWSENNASLQREAWGWGGWIKQHALTHVLFCVCYVCMCMAWWCTLCVLTAWWISVIGPALFAQCWTPLCMSGVINPLFVHVQEMCSTFRNRTMLQARADIWFVLLIRSLILAGGLYRHLRKTCASHGNGRWLAAGFFHGIGRHGVRGWLKWLSRRVRKVWILLLSPPFLLSSEVIGLLGLTWARTTHCQLQWLDHRDSTFLKVFKAWPHSSLH